MHRRLPLIALLAGALIPAPASAQVTASAEPNTPDSASRLKLGVDAAAPVFGSRVPTSIALLYDRGFQVDLATPAICGTSAGQGGGCPARSQVAAGTALVEASFLAGEPEQLTSAIEVFRTQALPAGAPADALAGLVAVIRVENRKSHSEGYVRRVDDGPFGYEVRFDAVATPGGTPPGTTVRLKRLDLEMGSTWRVPVNVARSVRCRQASKSRACKRRPGCRQGRRCARYRTVRETRLATRQLLRNPRSCAGSWASRTSVGFADGTSATVDAPIACAS